MEIEFDPNKNETNREKHGLSLDLFADLDFETVVVEPDTRRDYGEDRFKLAALLNGRLHVACFCIREDKYRIISLRKANPREMRRYERTQAEKAGPGAD